MVACWEPGTYYGPGSIVEYEGAEYKIIQPHTSQGDWTPPATPALWGRMIENVDCAPACPPPQQAPQDAGYNPGYIQPQQQQQAPPPQQPQQQYGNEKPWNEQQNQQVDIPHDERKKNWYDLDPARKKQLEVGGGLVAGLAAIGAGYFAYHEHQKSDEEKKANVWALQNWLHDAEQRTRAFYEHGPRGPVAWVLTQGTRIPPGAIPGGEQNGQTLFICRGFHEGGIQLGKVSADPAHGAMIGYAHKEIALPKYEVLVGDMRALRWVDVHGRADPERLAARPIEGGREGDGTPLFVAQGHHHNSVIPGKAGPKLKGAFVPHGNSEVSVDNYRILCYA